MALHAFPIRNGLWIRDEIRFSPLELSYLPFIERRFAFEFFERHDPIRSDIGKTTVQRGKRLCIQRRTVRIGGIAKVFQ